MEGLEEFMVALTLISDFTLIDTVREQANQMVKEDNPFFAALLRELANRYENSRRENDIPT